MKNVKFIILAGTMSVLLTACGGGGGSSPSTASTDTGSAKPQSPNVARTSDTPKNTQTSGQSATSETTDNTQTKPNPDNRGTPETTAQTTDTSDATQAPKIPLVLETPDGTRINLASGPKGTVEAKTDNGRVVGHNYTHAFYGVWLDNSKQLRSLHVQGIETPISGIPTSGSATYYGNAVRLDSINGAPLTDATSRINVHFGRKTVSGEITMPGLRRDITLHEGRLNGASYSGQASVIGNQSGLYEGKLYGPNANETAGIVKFRSNSDLDTAFGGKRY